ncbi:hypothetical protein Ancab_017097 [Ancistrocladus abbreviatus]
MISHLRMNYVHYAIIKFTENNHLLQTRPPSIYLEGGVGVEKDSVLGVGVEGGEVREGEGEDGIGFGGVGVEARGIEGDEVERYRDGGEGVGDGEGLVLGEGDCGVKLGGEGEGLVEKEVLERKEMVLKVLE